MTSKKPVVLIILDGFGVATPSDSNAVSEAKKPNLDRLMTHFPVFTLLASGESVGLSWGEIGNSEVGHMTLGLGRIFFQNLPRIDRAIADKSFFSNEAFLKAIEHAKKNKSKLHILGLTSDGRVHAHIAHTYAMLQLCKEQKFKDVYLHCFLDGRDSIYNSGEQYLEKLQQKIEEIGVGKIATVSGRFYAMDRDNHWERVEKVYRAMVEGQSAEYYEDCQEAIKVSYEKKVYDEEFAPVVIGKASKPTAVIEDGDAVIFMNYRADRAREICYALLQDDFDKFPRRKIANLFMASMIEYDKSLPAAVAYPKEEIQGGLSRVVSEAGLSQLHIAETEKYAHVTYFFNGGIETPYRGEDRVVIPSPRVSSYAQKPEMSAIEVTDHLLKDLMDEKHDFYVVNFANGDMVGHTGDVAATVKAVETLDWCVGQVVDLVLSKGGKVVITADHGNCEELKNLQTEEMSKDHSTNPVPCFVIAEEFRGQTNAESQLIGTDLSLLPPTGLLIDVTATVLKLLEIEIPKYMTGRPLV